MFINNKAKRIAFYKKVLFYLLLFIFHIHLLNAQTKIVKGIVLDDSNIPVDYFTVALLSTADSSILVGGAFADGQFSLDCLNNAKGVLQISSVGYVKQLVNIQFQSEAVLHIDTVRLSGTTIQEVTVRSSRPIITHTPNFTLVDVENTSLSTIGSSLDVLKRIPGVQFDNLGNITVMGKNSPTIIVNNNEIRTFSELELLQSSIIKSIEIQNTSSAQYNASGNAVIVIKTIKPAGNALNGQIYNRIFMARKFNNRAGVALNLTHQNTHSYLSYENIYRHNKHFVNDYYTNYQPLYQLQNESSKINLVNNKTHRANAGTNVKLNRSSELGVYYQLYLNTETDNSNITQSILKEQLVINRQINQKSLQNEVQHNFSLNYRYNIDSLLTWNTLADFALQIDTENILVDEKNLASQHLLNQEIENDNQFKVLTFKTDIEKMWLNGLEVSSGLKMAGIINHGTTNFLNLMSQQRVSDNQQIIRDNISAVYVQSNYEVKQWTFKGGLRAEHTNAKIKDYGFTVLDSSYLNFFPSFSATYKGKAHRYAKVNMSKTISRPMFKELNPSLTYYDSLMIGEGNPLLRPTISQNIGLEVGLARNVYISTEYSHRYNSRIKSAIPDTDNPDIIRFKPVNVPKSAVLSFNAGAGYNGKSLVINGFAGLKFPFDNINYLGNVIKNRTPGWLLSVSADYNFSSTLSTYWQVDYRSKYSELMSIYGETLDVSGGIQANFYKNKLSLTLDVSDLLNTSDISWEDKYGQIKIGRKPDYDTRYLRFIVNYKFNNFKSLNKSMSGNNDELRRL